MQFIYALNVCMQIMEKYILFGLKNSQKVIDEIIDSYNAFSISFEINLILTEALNNAYKHGNNKDDSKPIYLNVYFDGKYLNFKVSDTGNKINNLNIKKHMSDEDLLKDSGRGLFIINSITDNTEIKDNCLVMQKQLII